MILPFRDFHTWTAMWTSCAGRQSEADSLIHEVVRLGHEYDVDVPVYEKIAEKIK